ncbi:hypothetical protein BBO99_00001673 [Phytophthora kernoviae]|uniref:Helicase ATP-binding domain-containing protein n=2 Tax=Phytophthora kernoviae TaxID=325452 RepID=A0A3R7I0H8_9STRA|nr:hypothetical protein G195_005061 [Phytophthora kernoviae 00238/432]KAG2525742.1 hypothetical protein JM16_003998 [Phytophthora kernoviae]KAG2527329.1 hypothetical protein JM18_003808 [Phytophthora kernoviae]RLN31874.1 hypothetical protein BBI17_000476 [Phytophthora kernoviae]RLN83955.1 hypothetical protein BBO99_00001673 [Phytophthora kernoviae]
MSLLRRRPGASGSGQFKPFVLPVKGSSKASTTDYEDEDDWEDEAQNREALRSGASLSVKRLPFLSFLVMEPARRAQHLRRPFKSPCGEGGRSEESSRLLQVKTLGMRRRWSSAVMKPLVRHELPPLEVEVEEIQPIEPEPIAVEEPAADPVSVVDAPPPLVLWQSETDPEMKVVVPEIVGKFLRPHQREGVQFMFDCVSQIRGFDGQGCILADDMGLGKTLQSITLMYTLLLTGMDLKPTVKRAIVVCPTSLVKNWDDEIIKWLHGRVKTIALFEAKRETVIKGINQFIEGSKRPRPGFSAQVLIISYETFRMHAQKFADTPCCCDLLVCDEAHRLKNASSQINRALSSLACRKRVLLSGTPMQNDLEEFFAMVDFTNPNILGTPSEFRKNYLGPILIGREPDSSDHERNVAQSCSAMLCEIVNQFILRRGNILNAKHLPPKLMQLEERTTVEVMVVAFDEEALGYARATRIEDLNSWGHHRSYTSVDDEVMQAALQQVQSDLVSFAFSCRIDWELLQEHQAENEEKENQRDEERKRKRMEIVEAANKKRAQEEKKSKKSTSKSKKRKDSVDSDDLREFLSSSSSDEEDEGHPEFSDV